MTTEAPPAPVRALRQSWTRRVIAAVLRVYMRAYHHLEIQGGDNLPKSGPAIIVINHASQLDVLALMALDPYPNTATVVKASMFKIPLISWALRQWGAIPVERDGRDAAGVRGMLSVLRKGGVLAVAAEGRRTRTGRLEPINPVLARIAVSADVPIAPIGISGSYKALPAGAIVPRPEKIVVRAGPAFRLARDTDAKTAAERIRHEIAALLPADMQPLD